MTTHQIHEKYKDKYTTVMTEAVCDYIFNNDEKKSHYKKPKENEKICRLRASGMSYTKIAREMKMSASSVRECCVRVLRDYNWSIGGEKSKEMKDAVTSNFEMFCQKSGIHDVKLDELAHEISKLPIWGIDDQEGRKLVLKAWFYSEAKEE